MTFRDALARVGLTQSAASRMLGLGRRTVRGYCEPTDAPGHRDVPAPVWRLLDLMEHVPGVRERLAAHPPEAEP